MDSAADAGGDASLHLVRADFAAQLDVLTTTHDVVPLDHVLSEPAGSRPRAAITFDDAYRGALELGVALLAERGLPATVFVTPGMLGGQSFWWDAVRDASGGGLTPSFREAALALGGRTPDVLSIAAERGLHAAAVPARSCTATESELAAALAAHPGLTLGSHTWTHAALPTCTAAALQEELERPLSWLRTRFERVLPWISYPYGLSDAAVEAAAGHAGYAAGLRVEGGHVRPERDLLALPRLNIPAGLSVDGFTLRLAGLLAR